MTEKIQAKFQRDLLLTALTSVSSAQVDGDLGWVQMVFSGDRKVTVSAISHNLSIKYIFEGNYTGSGVVKVSGKQLTEYIRQLPSTDLDFVAELQNQLVVKCGRSQAKMQLIADQNVTEIAVPDIGTQITCSGLRLEQWANSFKDFVSLDDHRFFATGAQVSIVSGTSGNRLQAVASDALRLAKAQLTDGVVYNRIDQSAVLVPKRALEELRRVAAQNPSENFCLKWHQESAFFAVETSNYTMVAVCIAGDYPPYESAIPQQIHTRLEVQKQALIESIKRVLLFSDKNRTIKLNFNGPLLEVKSFTAGLKEGEEFVELLQPSAKEFELNYNGTLLQGILGAANGEKLAFEWDDVKRPVKILGEPEVGLDVFYLLVATRF